MILANWRHGDQGLSCVYAPSAETAPALRSPIQATGSRTKDEIREPYRIFFLVSNWGSDAIEQEFEFEPSLASVIDLALAYGTLTSAWR